MSFLQCAFQATKPSRVCVDSFNYFISVKVYYTSHLFHVNDEVRIVPSVIDLYRWLSHSYRLLCATNSAWVDDFAFGCKEGSEVSHDLEICVDFPFSVLLMQHLSLVIPYQRYSGVLLQSSH